jgi:predicted XRE-type DNA-binding protein
MSDNEIEIIRGSENVYADIGLSQPGQRLLKAHLMLAINTAVDQLGLTQTHAAALIGLKQSELSRIENGRGAGFSTDRLIEVLLRLGRDVEIAIVPAEAGAPGAVRLSDRSGRPTEPISALPGDAPPATACRPATK